MATRARTDLYAAWRAATDAAARDRLAALMEQRLEEMEPSEPPAMTHERAARLGDGARDETSVEDPHAALRADILLAIAAAGHDLDEARDVIQHRGVRLVELAPSLLPASEFYDRHATAIEARLDREVAAGGFSDLAACMTSWRWGRPSSSSLHDIEQAIVEHVLGDVLVEVEGAGRRELPRAALMYEQAIDQIVVRDSGRTSSIDGTTIPSARLPNRQLAGLDDERDQGPSTRPGGRAMTTSDDETVSERLAQARADRRHLARLRVAERRDAAHEGGAEAAAEREAQQPEDGQWPGPIEDSRTVLLAEEAALALEQSSLAADRDLGDDTGVDI